MTQEEHIQALEQKIEFLLGMVDFRDGQIEFRDGLIESEQKRNKFLMSLIDGNPNEPEKPNWKVYNQNK